MIALPLVAIFLQAAPGDPAVFAVFQHADAGMSHFALLDRTGVTEDLDLVVAIGSPRAIPPDKNSWTWWSEDRKIGLFLQEKTRPGLVYALGMKSGFQDCSARIQRVTATDTVISCDGEKSERYPHQKWVYDVRAKKLLKHFSYRPFAMSRGFPIPGGAVFIGSDTERQLAVEYKADQEPAFRLLGDVEARKWTERADKTPDKSPLPAVVPPLPQTTYDQFAAARLRRVKDGYVRAGTEIHDSIGPWQRDNGQIWFGKNFYDGEGSTGVGGFGYFDTNTRKLHMFELPEIADWSVSAIDVTPDAVWMALISNGEYGGFSGGVLRYDRQSGAVRHFELPDIGVQLVGLSGKMLAATDFGFAVIEGDRVTRYFIDSTTDGRLRVAEATR